MALTKGEVLSGLTALGISPKHQQQSKLADELNAICEAQGPSALDDLCGAELVRAFVRPLSGLATNERAAVLMAAQRMHVIRSDLCNACAATGAPAPVVLIFAGLLKAIVFVLEFSSIVDDISTQLGKLEEPKRKDTESNLQYLAYAGYSSLYYFVNEGHPLVRVGDVIRDGDKASLLIRAAKVLWFIMAHEIGHIQLGHLDDQTARTPLAIPSLALDEPLNDLKMLEFEADLFLCDLLSEREQYAILSYVLAPLDMFAQIERNLMLSKSTHPMSVNRLLNILTQRSHIVDEISAKAVRDVLARDTAAAERFDQNKDSYADRVSPADAREAINDLKVIYQIICPPDAEETDRTAQERALLWDHFANHVLKSTGSVTAGGL